MAAVDDAWLSFIHHSDMDPSTPTAVTLKSVFKAGWEAAGGDERLDGIEFLQERVSGCCDAGQGFCESFGCNTLKAALRALGDGEYELGDDE